MITAAPSPNRALAHQKDFIFTLEGVNKAFEGFKAISELNFYMNAGELRVIIGPNGAGKSTMLDIITGRTRPDTGKVEFGRDTDLTALNEFQINRLGIGRKFQTPSVYIEHPVTENIWLSLEGSRSVWSTLFSRISPEQHDQIYEVLINTVGLADTHGNALGDAMETLLGARELLRVFIELGLPISHQQSDVLRSLFTGSEKLPDLSVLQSLCDEKILLSQIAARHKETAHYARWRDAVAPMMAEPRASEKFSNVFPEDREW